MFILRLRSVIAPYNVFAVARSESAESLQEFIRSQVGTPVLPVKEGEAMRIFKQDGPLADFSFPSPGDEETGVLDLGSVEDRIEAAWQATRPSIEQQVRAAWDEMLDGTIEV